MPRPGYRTAAQEHGARMRASGSSYRGGYTQEEIREMKSYSEGKSYYEKIRDTWRIKDTAIWNGKKYDLHFVAYHTKEKALEKAKKIREKGYSVITDKRKFGHILWMRKK
jgi:hypothetical protein